METEQVVEDLQLQEPPELPEEEPTEEGELAAEPAQEPEEPAPPRKGRFQERIDELTKARKEAEEEAQNWRQEALRLATEREAKAAPEYTETPQAAPQLPPGIPPIPKYEDYDDPYDYHAAVARREAKIVAYEERQQATTETARNKAKEWVKEGTGKYPDFAEVATKLPAQGGPAITNDMLTAMYAIENGQDVAYHLGKNVSESLRIAHLHPVEQAVEIRKLASKIKMKSPKTTTEAPAPTKPVTGGRETVSTDNVEEKIRKGTVSYREYEAYMNAKEQRG